MPKPILPLCICGDFMCTIPYGYCHCRCGEKTDLSPVTQRSAGWIKGQPRRYVFNHHGRKRSRDRGCESVQDSRRLLPL